jgi:hypothetical protein
MEDLQQELIGLNIKIGEMEQSGGDAAVVFFTELLSDKLIFHRANGKIDGKEPFLAGLTAGTATPRLSADPIVHRVDGMDDRFLVTLTVTTNPDREDRRQFRNVRFFSRTNGAFKLESWYNYELIAPQRS